MPACLNAVIRLVPILLSAWCADAAQRRETLIYSRFDIDPGEWRYFPFPAKTANARLDVRFEVLSPKDSAGIRVIVLTDPEFQRYSAGQPHREVTSSSYQRDGTVQGRLSQTGGYAVVIENRKEGQRKSRVDLEVTLTTGPEPETLPVAYASPRKRLVVVSVSLAGFVLIVVLAGQVLWRAMRRNDRKV